MKNSINLEKLQLTNRLIVTEALQRGWGVEVIDYRLGLISYALPGRSKNLLLKSTKGPFTTVLEVDIANDKIVSSVFAARAGLSVPGTQLFVNKPAAKNFLQKYERIVVKPIDAAHGKGITTNVDSWNKFEIAYKKSRLFSEEVILQEFVEGDDIRLLFIGGKFRAAAIRRPAEVIGDGKHDIEELIEIENKSGKRAPNYLLPLNLIDKSAAAEFLGEKMHNIPPRRVKVAVVGTANIGTGGYAIDITDDIEIEVVAEAQKLVDLLELQVCALDFIRERQKRKLYFIEINAGPSFGLHVYPAIGKSRPLAKMFLDWIEEEY